MFTVWGCFKITNVMSKKIKVKGVLRLEGIELKSKGCFIGDRSNYRVATYILDGLGENTMFPDEIEFTIKRKPKTISEYMKVNNLDEKEVLEFLNKKFKK